MTSSQTSSGTSHRFLFLLGATIAVLSFFVYGQILSHRFITLDDLQLIFFNPTTKGLTLANIKAAFTTFDPELYIPLTLVSYQLEYMLAGTNAALTHTTNILLHSCNAFFVGWLVLLLSKNKSVAAGTALLFALHPLHTEAVAWASARKDLLSSFFFLSSCISFFLWHGSTKKFPYGSFLLFFLGLLSKALVLPLPIVLILLLWVRRVKIEKSILLVLVPFFLASIVFGVIGLFGKQDIVSSLTVTDTLLMATKSTSHYMLSFFIPAPLVVMYPQSSPISILLPEFWIPAVLVLSIGAASILSLRKTRVVFGATAFFFLLLIPTFINFAKAGDIYFASDRYAYLPSISAFFLTILGIDRIVRYRDTVGWQTNMRSIAHVLGGTTLLILVFMSRAQAAVWQDSIALFTHSVSHYPDSSAAHLNLGVLHLESGDPMKAIEHFKKSAEIRMQSPALAGLASAYHTLGRNEDAVKEYNRAIVFDPDDAEPHFGLANLYAEIGEEAKAVAEYEKSIEIDPRYVAAYNNFGVLLMSSGNLERAETMLTKARSLNPAFGKTHFNLGKLYQAQRRNSEAIESFRSVLNLDQDSVEAMVNLAASYVVAIQPQEAFSLLKKALALEPDNGDAKALVKEMIRLKMIGENKK